MNEAMAETIRAIGTAVAAGAGGAWWGRRKANAEADKTSAEAQTTISGEALKHVAALRDELTELRARLDLSDERYSDLYSKHLELQAQIARLERTIEDRDASLVRLTNEKNAATEEVIQLRRVEAEQQRRIDELEAEVARLRSRIEELERGAAKEQRDE